VQEGQDPQETAGQAVRPDLLTAQQVQDLLRVDRSTVYRMAESGRLTAVKVGRQWRFPAASIRSLLHGSGVVVDDVPAVPRRTAPQPPSTPDRQQAGAVLALAADLLGVMLVVTDMDGRPLTDVVNPCPWFAERLDDPSLLETCTREWQELADEPDLEPRFRTGAHGFDCARAFVRSGSRLVGMVLAGGIAPRDGAQTTEPGLYHLDGTQRQRVLTSLPRVAAALSSVPARDARPRDGRKAS
jgi:excisionase family DNA binding protein